MRLVYTNILKNHRDLLYAWTGRIIRARYQQSILGGLWAVFQPAATVAILTLVFSYFVRLDTGETPYVVFSYSAMVPWMLFSSSISDMVESIVSNMNLVAKIHFPREVLVISALLARVLDFFIAFLLLIVLLLYFQLPVFSAGWIYLPLILLIQLLLALGVGLAGAAFNVFLRDAKHLFTLGLQLWMYATPIIYPISLIPKNILPYYSLNPMVGIIEGYRQVLIHGSTPGSNLAIAALISLLVFIAGFWFFKRVEYQFADVI